MFPIHFDRERVTIQSKNMMRTVGWSPTGFSVVTALDSECKFNAVYDVNKVLMPLSE
jgi:hypothetical protein